MGPNGCGKSNIIDAVRWVMGEISAKHLRGESMADVIFNGSVGAQALGAASVELVFDNSDGKIGGEYARYNEVALRRAVSRDGTSDYFINGIKVRRKDITQLFLGTGLGTRSYAIIEQGMISRVIEARPDDLRAFLEEAAGISRYKERRRETESRIGHTRENLDRLNDLREEVEKQIRHLQRQAATARRYQTLKEEERKLQAEVLALRLQSLDAEARRARRGDRAAARPRCRRCSRTCARPRRRSSASAPIKPPRPRRWARSRARFYEAGAEVTRIEQSIQYRARAAAAAARGPGAGRGAGVGSRAPSSSATAVQLEALAQELATMVPGLDAAHAEERHAPRVARACEQALAAWQQAWDAHAQAVAHGQRETAGRARPHRAARKPAAPAAAAARAAGERSAPHSRSCSRRRRWRLWRSSARARRAMRVRRPPPSCRSCWREISTRPATGSASRAQALNALARALAAGARARRFPPKRCSRRRSARRPARSPSG